MKATIATIKNAHKLVEALYNENKDNKEIRQPISYALYYAWERMRWIEKPREVTE